MLSTLLSSGMKQVEPEIKNQAVDLRGSPNDNFISLENKRSSRFHWATCFTTKKNSPEINLYHYKNVYIFFLAGFCYSVIFICSLSVGIVKGSSEQTNQKKICQQSSGVDGVRESLFEVIFIKKKINTESKFHLFSKYI